MGKGQLHFSAVPSETPEQRLERVNKEKAEEKEKKIQEHKDAIMRHEEELKKLEAE